MAQDWVLFTIPAARRGSWRTLNSWNWTWKTTLKSKSLANKLTQLIEKVGVCYIDKSVGNVNMVQDTQV